MDIRKLGGLIQSLKIGMTRQEVENLFGKVTSYASLGDSLYNIDDLRQVVDVSSDQQISIPVYLLVKFEGDEERKQTFLQSGGDFEELKKGLKTDKLLTFAIAAIGE